MAMGSIFLFRSKADRSMTIYLLSRATLVCSEKFLAEPVTYLLMIFRIRVMRGSSAMLSERSFRVGIFRYSPGLSGSIREALSSVIPNFR